MSYDPDLLELIKVLRIEGHSPITIKNHAALIEYCDMDKDQLSAAVDYYVAELEDRKELMVASLDHARLRMTQLLNSEKAGTKIAAGRVLVSIIDRYAKLLGLDSPMKIDSTQRTLTVSVEGVDMVRLMEQDGYAAIEPSQDS